MDITLPDAINAKSMFKGCTALKTARVKIPNGTGVGAMFASCSSLEHVHLDIPLATQMYTMFDNGCARLCSVDGDLSSITGYISAYRYSAHNLTHYRAAHKKLRNPGTYFFDVMHLDLESALWVFDQLIYGSSKVSFTMGLNAFDQSAHPITGEAISGCLVDYDGTVKRKWDFVNGKDIYPIDLDGKPLGEPRHYMGLADFVATKNYNLTCKFFATIGAATTVSPSVDDSGTPIDETYDEYIARTGGGS